MKAFYIILITICLTGCKKDPTPLFDQTATVTPKDYLTDSKYTKLVIQMDYVPGYEPSANAVSHITSFLQQRIHKPSGIEITYSAIASPNKTAFTLNDIKAVEKANRRLFTHDQVISLYVFFADGEYIENTGSTQVLGLKYSSSSLVIFEKTVKNYAGGIGQPSLNTLQALITEHELGHILGLVNSGTAMVSEHQDGAHGKHCNNSNCLMYYTAETNNVIANLVGNNIPSLDNDCISDLRANGGK